MGPHHRHFNLERWEEHQEPWAKSFNPAASAAEEVAVCVVRVCARFDTSAVAQLRSAICHPSICEPTA